MVSIHSLPAISTDSGLILLTCQPVKTHMCTKLQCLLPLAALLSLLQCLFLLAALLSLLRATQCLLGPGLEAFLPLDALPCLLLLAALLTLLHALQCLWLLLAAC